jgi:hypothetical protein
VGAVASVIPGLQPLGLGWAASAVFQFGRRTSLPRHTQSMRRQRNEFGSVLGGAIKDRNYLF